MKRFNTVGQFMNAPLKEQMDNFAKIDFTISTLSATIIEQREADSRELYKIRITDNFHNKVWDLTKDYNDFDTLQKNLTYNFLDVPQIPEKVNSKNNSVVKLRLKEQFNTFLKNCICRKDIYSSEEFKNFLEIYKNSPELCGNIPVMNGSLENLPQSIVDFKYIPEEKIILICTSNLGVNSKTSENFLLFKNRLESNEDYLVNPLGMLLIFSVIQNEDKSYSFKELWQKKFKVPTSTLYFNFQFKTIFVGLADGFVSIYKPIAKSGYTELEHVIDLKNHFSTVTGIWFNNYKGKMFTVSHDRRFVASNVDINAEMVEISRSVYDYTGLYSDTKYNRIFASTECGILEVYSTEIFPPEKKCRIRISGCGYITDFYYNISNFNIFTCDKNGKISIIELGGLGKEKISSEISQFGFKNVINVIDYDSVRHEIITGDQNGKITIWNLKTGKPTFSWVVHNMGVNRLYYDESSKMLFTGSMDKSIKIWKIPEYWYNPEIEKYEKEQLEKINNEIAKKRIQMQQMIQDNEELYDSENSIDENDINGWNKEEDEKSDTFEEDENENNDDNFLVDE